MNVSDFGEHLSYYTIDEKATFQEALDVFNQSKRSSLPVVSDAHRVVGVLSLFQILPHLLDGNLKQKKITPWIERKEFAIAEEGQASPAADSNQPICFQEKGRPSCLDQPAALRYFSNQFNRRNGYLQNIFDKIYCGIIYVNSEGNIDLLNTSGEKILQVERNALMGKGLESLKDFGHLNTFHELISLKHGQGRFKCQIKDDYVICNVHNVNEENNNGIVTIFHQSLNERCLFQEIEVTEKLLNEITIFLESSYDGIFVTDKEGKVIRVNSAWERIFSVYRKDVIGKNVKELVEKGVYGKSAAQLVLKTQKKATVMFENKGRKIMATGSPVFNELGEFTSTVVNVRDITELEYLKNQLEKNQKLAEQYYQEIKEMRRQQQRFPDIVMQSKSMQKVMDMVLRVAEVDSTILITGESGVGKDVIAGLIHKLSPRSGAPMIKINCGAIPGSLLESELFGYEPGAFTGAKTKGKLGFFELANTGTLFLDEIAEMPLELQVKLLRVIQEKEIIKVGGIKPVKIDVRIVAATNQDLIRLIEQGKFREDLYYRLNVINIKIPPLRERKEDIAPLIIHFLDKYNQKYAKTKIFPAKTIHVLQQYAWPGNIRQLENLVENLVVLTKQDEITPDSLPESYSKLSSVPEKEVVVNGIIPLKEATEMLEAQLLKSAEREYGTTRLMAKALGVNQSTIVRKMKQYCIGDVIVHQ